jgi:hypothetical protein
VTAPLEVVNDLGTVWATQPHEEVVTVVHYVEHEGVHLLLIGSAGCVHIFQLFGMAKQSR